MAHFTQRFDFVVVGSGLAGLGFALHAAQFGTVCVVTKSEAFESNTSWAQGGIAAAVGEADSWKLHEEDTLIAGAGLCDAEAVRYLVQQAPEAIRWLVSLGAPFDRELDGELALGLEGAHSRNRIVHAKDRTGWEVENVVLKTVKGHPKITVFEQTFVTGLLMAEGRCVGVEAFEENQGAVRFLSRAVMIATGGCGRMYQHTTNPRVATADGIALAASTGAEIRDMEFMQFHPTTLYHAQLRSFLISEAVRGAGATLRNHLGRRFMYDYDDRLELAPRDIVSRSIESEMKRLETWCVYLDTTHLKGEDLKDEFPTIYERLSSIGVEMEKDWIPVVPAQHFSCGGIVTNLHGQSSVPGLYAAGEVARTGVHGANRLASNSLLEALVFSAAAALSAKNEPSEIEEGISPFKVKSISEADSIRIRRALGKIMTQYVGIVRTNQGLAQALETSEALINEYDALPEAGFSQHPLETHNLLISAQHVIRGAIARKTNVGLHFNADLV